MHTHIYIHTYTHTHVYIYIIKQNKKVINFFTSCHQFEIECVVSPDTVNGEKDAIVKMLNLMSKKGEIMEKVCTYIH